MLEPVTPEDRIAAAASIARDPHPKAQAVALRILAGEADHHPSVRARADYREIARG